jgi:hypothetical protein
VKKSVRPKCALILCLKPYHYHHDRRSNLVILFAGMRKQRIVGEAASIANRQKSRHGSSEAGCNQNNDSIGEQRVESECEIEWERT